MQTERDVEVIMLRLRLIFHSGRDRRDGLNVRHDLTPFVCPLNSLGLISSTVTYVLQPYDLPLTCWASVQPGGDTTSAATPNPRHRFQLTNKGHTVLPGKWLAKMEEPSAGAIVGKCG